MIRYGSVCSGIEAASVAVEPLGWQAAWFAEVEAFPSAVLAHHWPHVPNLGDMTAIAARIRAGEVEAPDVLVGGTPCQAFSVAGLRGGLSDQRGQLTLSYVDLANAIDSARFIRQLPSAVAWWENVPGVLNTKDNAFGCFLGALAGEECELHAPGGKWPDAGCVSGPQRAIAWRVLDAQYFGLAQRRRRVFVIASARDGFDPAKILFEFDGVRRDSPPGRGAPQDVAGTIEASIARGRGAGTSVAALTLSPAKTLTTREGRPVDGTRENLVVLGVEQPDVFALQDTRAGDKAQNGCGWSADGVSYTVDTRATQGVALAFPANLSGTQSSTTENLSPALGAKNPTAVATAVAVRRLTPTECERLQGFPDGHTAIPWRGKAADDCPDGPRYKALGNSMAVPCMAWIGRRLDLALGGQAQHRMAG